jgi:cytochrome P450
MIDDIIVIFVAGQETTAGALTNSFLELMLNPDCFQKLV